jgi:hypothetical protein
MGVSHMYKRTLTGDLNSVLDTNSLAVVELLLGALSETFVVKVM